MGVIDTARRRGLRVPEDLSVVGFDDIRFARYLDPPLTTITQPMREIGEGCVRLLLEILSGRAPRAGVGDPPPPVDDPLHDGAARPAAAPADAPEADRPIEDLAPRINRRIPGTGRWTAC